MRHEDPAKIPPLLFERIKLYEVDGAIRRPVTMYVCQLCDHFVSRRLASVLSHIGAVHSHQSGFSVLCGIDGCPRTYRNYQSFRRHIKQKHPSACDDCDSPTESNVTDMQTIGGENCPEDLSGESFGDPVNQSTSKKKNHCLVPFETEGKISVSTSYSQ